MSRYRPRLLTVLVLVAVSALLVLANLTDELRERRYPAFPTPPDTRFEFEAGKRAPGFHFGVFGCRMAGRCSGDSRSVSR